MPDKNIKLTYFIGSVIAECDNYIWGNAMKNKIIKELQEQAYLSVQTMLNQKISPQNTDKEYLDLWCRKKAVYSYFDTQYEYVLFLDGKNITKNHIAYNLLDENNFTKILHMASVKIMEQYGFDTIIYTGIDEVSILFKKIESVVNTIGEAGNITTTTQILIQKVLKEMLPYFPYVELRGCMFPIEHKDESKYIEYRKKIIYDLAVMYFAKEHFSSKLYHDKPQIELLELFKAKDLYNDFLSHKELYEGYLTNVVHKPDLSDLIRNGW